MIMSAQRTSDKNNSDAMFKMRLTHVVTEVLLRRVLTLITVNVERE